MKNLGRGTPLFLRLRRNRFRYAEREAREGQDSKIQFDIVVAFDRNSSNDRGFTDWNSSYRGMRRGSSRRDNLLLYISNLIHRVPRLNDVLAKDTNSRPSRIEISSLSTLYISHVINFGEPCVAGLASGRISLWLRENETGGRGKDR